MFHVICPICGGKLLIDDAAREVVGHTPKEHVEKESDQKMEEILGKLRKEAAEREAKLEWARSRSAERRKKAEELFKRASEKAKEEGGPPPAKAWD